MKAFLYTDSKLEKQNNRFQHQKEPILRFKIGTFKMARYRRRK
ncbi:hypothetical protein HMPREF0653_01160 [Prevotella disiens JCM 6334 = ATCC 29426]|uniref:Uncharacterized protein n=1 Tax=Prevotella disiens JCM 6334 = ATCC 29426 TaxID=1235811 RepID=A0ABN0NSR1_9BACT|nr:hypothetical protein HMPREF0653_01160 [Prevotella disiens JCM 6334 = ATCC 29426]